MRTQDLFTEKLKNMAESRGLTFVNDTNWANTGTYRFFDADFAPVLHVEYNFQTSGPHGYATFTVGSDQMYRKTSDIRDVLTSILTALDME